MTDIHLTELHSQFAAALSRGELPEAVEYAVRIEDAEAPPRELATQLRDALSNGDDGLAATLLGALKRRYEALDASESAAVARSTLARQQLTLNDGAVETLTKHAKAAGEAATARAGVFTTVAAFLQLDESERTASRRSDATAAVSQLIEAERTRNERQEAAARVVESVTLPPSISVLSAGASDETFAVGQPVDLEVVVGNVGDGPATGVTLAVDAPDGLTLSRTSVTVGDLAAGERSTMTATMEASRPEQFEYTVEAVSDDAGHDSDRVVVTVTETITTFASALDTNENGLLDTDEIQRAVELYLEGEPVPYTDTEGGETMTNEDLRRLIVKWAKDRPV